MRWLLVLGGWLLPLLVQAADVTVLTYHDIVDDPKQDKYAVSTTEFRKQLDYLKQNGFRPVSLAQFLRAIQQRTRLPDKAVMLTFDDGLVSYQGTVVPLLKQYGYPSVLSIVSGWVGGEEVPGEYRGKLLDWPQLRLLGKEPLVEIVSHSHGLHRWVVSSPQDTYAPAAITRIYYQQPGRYETEKAFRNRIRNDLLKAKTSFRKELGFEPVVLTWPYGEYDQVTMNIARLVGFRYQLTLDEGQASRFELPRIRRYMLLRDHKVSDLAAMLTRTWRPNTGQRFVEFDLDVFAYVSNQNHGLLIQQLVDRIESLGANTVVVTPFTAAHDKAFFPNNYLPVDHDLLNGVLDRIRSQLGLEQVYIRFPAGTEKLPVDLFAELARNSRFNAVLFDSPPSPARLQQMRLAMQKYLPELRLGSWRVGNRDLDIAVIDAADTASLAKGKGKVLAYVDRKAYLTTAGLSDALRALRNKGLADYGYGSLNFMAGAQAPPEVIEAMAYPLPRGNRP